MHREAGILQQRIDVVPLQRRRPHPGERVGRGQREEQEASGDDAQHADDPGAQRGWQIAAEGGDRGAAPRQDQAPQQHRSFVISPGAGDLVDQRLCRGGVLRHVEHREVVGHRAPDQARQRTSAAPGTVRRRARALPPSGAGRAGSPRSATAPPVRRQGRPRAPARSDPALDSWFRTHPPLPSLIVSHVAGGGGSPWDGSQWPLAFRACTTSLGI